METVKEVFQSIYDSYRDRIKSPLVGSFIVTYLIFNWRLVAILFYSEWPIHCRIEWIEENYCNWYNYIIPFGLALFYVLGLPYINLGFDKLLTNYSDTQLDKKNNAKIKKLQQKVLEADEVRKIADAKAGTSKITILDDKIESLQNEIKLLEEQNKIEVERWSQQISTSNEKEREFNKLINARDKQIKSLENQSRLLRDYDWVLNNPLYKNTDIYAVKAVIDLSDDMIDAQKQNFIKFVEDLRSNKSYTYMIDTEIFEKLSLVEIKMIDNLKHTSITPYGNLFFDYIKSGRDLL